MQPHARVLLAGSVDSATPPLMALLSNLAMDEPMVRRVLSSPDQRIELAVSLGVQLPGTLHTGVGLSDWQRVSQFIADNPSAAPARREHVTEFVYTPFTELMRQFGQLPPSSPPSLRAVQPQRLVVTADVATGAIVMCEIVMPYNAQVINAPGSYDMNVSITYKCKLPLLRATLTAVPENWTVRREKERTIARLERAPDWEICLTRTVSSDRAELPFFEVDYVYAPTQYPFGEPVNQRTVVGASARTLLAQVLGPTNTIHGRARRLGPSVLPPFVHELLDAPPNCAREISEITARWYGANAKSKTVFCGAMPTLLTRAQMFALHTDATNTYVCERTDGLRMMLAIVPGRWVCLISESGQITVLGKRYAAFEAALLGLRKDLGQGPTLLDGELVERRNAPGRYTFLVRDACMVGGRPARTTPFAARVAGMRRIVAHELQSLDVPDQPFDFRAKKYARLPHAHLLEQRIRDSNGTRLFQYGEAHLFAVRGYALVHATTPDQCTAYEWIPRSQITVNLQPVTIDARQYKLHASSGEALVPIASLALTATEQENMARVQLDSELAARMQPPVSRPTGLPVIECRYDPDAAQWQFVRFRTDKRTANTVGEAVTTVLSMVAPVGLPELFGAGTPAWRVSSVCAPFAE